MSGPVPGLGSPSPRPSSVFFGLELREFVLVVVVVGVVVVNVVVGVVIVNVVVVVIVIVVVIVNIVVVFLVCRGAFRAVAGATAGLFFGRHRGMAVVVAGASKAA